MRNYHPTNLKIDQLSQNFVIISNTLFPGTVTKTRISVVILKTILFTFLHNMFTLLVINVNGVNKRQAEINFHLTEEKHIIFTNKKENISLF
jgi:hypothetical protein